MRRGTVRRVFAVFALATFAGATAAAGAVQVPTSGWNWSNPQPQGRAIYDIAVVDATRAYAGGDLGTLLATADGGQTWTGIRTGSHERIAHVAAAGADMVAYATGCDVWRSTDRGATLRRLSFRVASRVCANPVTGLEWTTPNDGFILLIDGSLIATNDGGQTFSRRANVPTTAGSTLAMALSMSSTTPGLGLAVTTAGAIHRTTDGGASWVGVASAPGPLFDVVIASATTAYAVGHGMVIYKSVDAGATWTPFSAMIPIADTFISTIRCVDADHCAVGTGPGAVATTGDGGTTFTPASLGGFGFAAAFLSPSRVVAAGLLGQTFVSANGGSTWQRVDRRLTRPMSGIRTNPDGFTYVWGPVGALAASSDGGGSWVERAVATSAAVRAVSFATHDVGYAVDRAGVAFKTTNGGTSWQILDTGSGFTPTDVFAVSPDRLVVLGAGGALRRSTDGGQTFSIAGTTATRPIARRGGQVGTTVALYGQRAIALTTNAGGTWRIVNGPSDGRTRLLMRTAHCPGVLTCWAVTTRNRVFRTINGGRAWTEVTASIGKNFVAGARFTNRNTGFLVLSGSFDATRPDGGAWLLRTSDGGRTWMPQLVSSGQPLTLASGGGRDFALDVDGNIFTSTSGGQAATPSGVSFGVSALVVRRGGSVTITGRLTPAQGGERIVISTSDGRARAVTANAKGVFTTTLLVTRTTSFVAQWAGDGSRMGAGSRATTVRVR